MSEEDATLNDILEIDNVMVICEDHFEIAEHLSDIAGGYCNTLLHPTGHPPFLIPIMFIPRSVALLDFLESNVGHEIEGFNVLLIKADGMVDMINSKNRLGLIQKITGITNTDRVSVIR